VILGSQVNYLLNPVLKYGFCNIYTIQALAEEADLDLLTKTARARHSIAIRDSRFHEFTSR